MWAEARSRAQRGSAAPVPGGSTWAAATQLVGPMSHSWVARTRLRRSLGPSGSVLNEAMYSTASGLTAATGTAPAEGGEGSP
jgi:hypothetical protein